MRDIQDGKLEFARLCETFQISESELQASYPEAFECRKSFRDRVTTSGDGVRVCPRCLAHGYHASIHDLTFLDRCPIHGCDLLDACASCGRGIPFNPPLHDPFTCGCGEALPVERGEIGDIELEPLRQTAAWIHAFRHGMYGKSRRQSLPMEPREQTRRPQMEHDFLKAFARCERGFRDRCRQTGASHHFAVWRQAWYGRNAKPVGDTLIARFDAIFSGTAGLDGRLQVRLFVGALLGTFAELLSNNWSPTGGQSLRDLSGQLVPYAIPAADGSIIGLRAVAAVEKVRFPLSAYFDDQDHCN